MVSDVTPAGTVTVWLRTAPPPPAPPHCAFTNAPLAGVHLVPRARLPARPAPRDERVPVRLGEVTRARTAKPQLAVPQLLAVKVWVGPAVARACGAFCAGDAELAAVVRAAAARVVGGRLVVV